MIKRLLLLAALCLPVFAQTAINDTLYLQGATPWTGQITVSWPAFTSCTGAQIARGSRVSVVNAGAVSVSLWPTDCAAPSFAYSAVYKTMGGTNHGLSWSETWAIPSSPSIVTLGAVRQSSTLKFFPSQIIAGGLADGTYCINVASEAATGLVACSGGGGGSVAWTSVTGKPSTFTPSAHASTHASGGTDAVTLAESQVTGLVSDLAGKAASGASTTVNGQTCALGSSCTVADSTKAPLSNPTFSGTVTIGATAIRGGGTSLPGTCAAGDQFFLSTGTIGLYICTATNTWALAGGGTSPVVATFTAPSTCSTAGGTGTNSCTLTSGVTLAVTHNLGTSRPWVVCFDGSGNQLGSVASTTSVTSVVATSSSVSTITFSASTSGSCAISTGAMGPVGATGASGSSGANGSNGAGFNGRGTYASMTASSPATNDTWELTDASTAGSCSAGSGTAKAVCVWTGSTWVSAAGSSSVASTSSALKGDGAGGAVAVTGTATDCVRVNGTTGACGGTTTSGATLPGTCAVGDLYTLTAIYTTGTASYSPGAYTCTATNTWANGSAVNIGVVQAPAPITAVQGVFAACSSGCTPMFQEWRYDGPTITFSQMGLYVQTAASSSANGVVSGIYDATGTNGGPGTLIAQITFTGMNSTGMHVGNSAATISRGTYYIAHASEDTTMVLYGWTSSAQMKIAANAGSKVMIGLCGNKTTGTGATLSLPGTCGTVSTGTTSSNNLILFP